MRWHAKRLMRGRSEEGTMVVRYTVSDGKLVLNVVPAEEGTIEEAFSNARDALRTLKRSRSKLHKQLRAAIRTL
jgi:hypothetical protein